MTRPQRRWHLLLWLALVPAAVTVLALAAAQQGEAGGVRTPQLEEQPR